MQQPNEAETAFWAGVFLSCLARVEEEQHINTLCWASERQLGYAGELTPNERHEIREALRHFQ